LRRPTHHLAVAFNHATREEDEWFEEPDDGVDRSQRLLDAWEVVRGAGQCACCPHRELVPRTIRYASTAAASTGSSPAGCSTATALKWRFLPPDGREFGELLVRAAAGNDVESEVAALLVARRPLPND
jgi:hypothetical protein